MRLFPALGMVGYCPSRGFRHTCSWLWLYTLLYVAGRELIFRLLFSFFSMALFII
uniref:Uncharacterized protein n=1 Tax=Anguilla anguilla TaxID=7936 RepID=A0A0E9W399_ANGAN